MIAKDLKLKRGQGREKTSVPVPNETIAAHRHG